MSDKIREAFEAAYAQKAGCDVDSLRAARWSDNGYRDPFAAAAWFGWQAALAQQPAAAVPDGWKWVPVNPTPEMIQAGRDEPLAGEADEDAPEDYRAVYRAMLSAAPAAPVAQEPVAWRVSDPNEPEIGFWLSEEPGTSWHRSEPLYTAPPAAEQPDADDLVVWRITLPSGESCHFGTESMAKAWGRGSGKVERVDLKARPALELVAAEQPDTVMVPRELLAEAESIIDSYAEALKASHAPGGDWDGEEVAQDDYERESGVASKLRALLGEGDEA